jgi:hypothetical protein
VSFAETWEHTYTTADIGKVFDCFAADLDMTSQSTGLLEREYVMKLAGDVKLMAQNDYLVEANICLYDSNGSIIRAAKYEVTSDTSSLRPQRPGNNLWPKTPGGSLMVIVRYSPEWKRLSEEARQTFKRRLSLSWSTSSADLSFPTLTRSFDRSYASNGYGVIKNVFR